MINANIFGIRLKQARKLRNLTQAKLGVLAGIDEYSASARMNQYERGKHLPDYLIMTRIAEILEIPVAYFFAENELTAEILRLIHEKNDLEKELVINFINNNLTLK